MDEGTVEHRRFPRLSSAHALMVERCAEPREGGFARVRDLGLGGCMFSYPEPLSAGSPLRLLISAERLVIQAEGRVAYVHPDRRGGYDVGVEFTRVPRSHREVLRRLLESLPVHA